MADRCEIAPVNDATAWAELLARVAHPHLTQIWTYGEAKELAKGLGLKTSTTAADVGSWRPRRIAFTCGEDPLAIAQVLEKRVVGITCAYRINRGPLFLEAEPSRETIERVYRAIRTHWSVPRRGPLVIAPALPASDENTCLLKRLGFRPRDCDGWISSRLDITKPQEELRANLVQKWRNRLNAAERAGLVFRRCQLPEELDWILDRHAENMAAKHFEKPPVAFARALYEADPSNISAFQALLGAVPIGSILTCRYSRGAEYFIGWTHPEYRNLSIGNFLYWNTLLALKDDGCEWIDFGGHRSSVMARFKRGLNGTVYELLSEWLSY